MILVILVLRFDGKNTRPYPKVLNKLPAIRDAWDMVLHGCQDKLHTFTCISHSRRLD